jgi:hypothetical protein
MHVLVKVNKNVKVDVKVMVMVKGRVIRQHDAGRGGFGMASRQERQRQR